MTNRNASSAYHSVSHQIDIAKRSSRKSEFDSICMILGRLTFTILAVVLGYHTFILVIDDILKLCKGMLFFTVNNIPILSLSAIGLFAFSRILRDNKRK